jgi:hypothetical protein
MWRIGEKRNNNKILVEKLEWKIRLGRPKCRWEENITINRREIGLKGVDWIDPQSMLNS